MNQAPPIEASYAASTVEEDVRGAEFWDTTVAFERVCSGDLLVRCTHVVPANDAIHLWDDLSACVTWLPVSFTVWWYHLVAHLWSNRIVILIRERNFWHNLRCHALALAEFVPSKLSLVSLHLHEITIGQFIVSLIELPARLGWTLICIVDGRCQYWFIVLRVSGIRVSFDPVDRHSKEATSLGLFAFFRHFLPLGLLVKIHVDSCSWRSASGQVFQAFLKLLPHSQFYLQVRLAWLELRSI